MGSKLKTAYDTTLGWNLQIYRNTQIYKTETHSDAETYSDQKGKGVGEG